MNTIEKLLKQNLEKYEKLKAEKEELKHAQASDKDIKDNEDKLEWVEKERTLLEVWEDKQQEREQAGQDLYTFSDLCIQEKDDWKAILRVEKDKQDMRDAYSMLNVVNMIEGKARVLGVFTDSVDTPETEQIVTSEDHGESSQQPTQEQPLETVEQQRKLQREQQRKLEEDKVEQTEHDDSVSKEKKVEQTQQPDIDWIEMPGFLDDWGD